MNPTLNPTLNRDIPASFTTIGGRRIDLLDPDPDMIDLGDIAHALGRICRFGGHLEQFYSVAQHSVHVLDCLRASGGDPSQCRAALMHDATEAYLGDVISPLKHLLPRYNTLESRFEAAIALQLGIVWNEPTRAVTKRADRAVYAGEVLRLRDPAKIDLSRHSDPSIFDSAWLDIDRDPTWTPARATAMFLRAATDLGVGK